MWTRYVFQSGKPYDKPRQFDDPTIAAMRRNPDLDVLVDSDELVVIYRKHNEILIIFSKERP